MKHGLDLQVNRTAMIWLLVSQILVYLPFINWLPKWLMGLIVVAGFWRFRALKGHNKLPGSLIKTAAVVFGLVGLYFSDLPIISLEAATSLLILGFGLKNLELANKRDGYIVIFIAIFLIASAFLYDQQFLQTVYGLFCLTVLVAAMISLQQRQSEPVKTNLKIAAIMLSQCIPLMLVGYLLFPRLPPLWSVPSPDAQGVTGMSDTVSPGDLASLAQSDRLAFRAEFDGERPPQHKLYWRGLVLEQFDGQTWRIDDRPKDNQSWNLPFRQYSGLDILEYSYNVYIQSAQNDWLYTLTPSINSSGNARRTQGYNYESTIALVGPQKFSFTSYGLDSLSVELSEKDRQINLQLPTSGNDLSRSFVREQRLTLKDDLTFAQSILSWISQDQFFYSLKPPRLTSSDRIDEFLFQTKTGFCEHFASSFIYLMRLAGIPSRMVVGYQGGEWNDEQNYFIVRQYDAHAWVEIWVEDKGWIQMDPTAWVAPSRVELGLEEAVRGEGTFLSDQFFSPRQFGFLSNLRLQLDELQFQWQKMVVNYDPTDQMAIYRNLFGDSNTIKTAAIVAMVFAAIVALWGFMLGLFRLPNPLPLEVKAHQEITGFLGQIDPSINGSVSPSDLLKPEFKSSTWWPDLNQMVMALNNLLYLPEDQKTKGAEELKSSYVSLRRKLKAELKKR